jgi:hypothetical protein
MTIDVNAKVRYTTGGKTSAATVVRVKNGLHDIIDLAVDGGGTVQDVPRSADGIAATNDTWQYASGQPFTKETSLWPPTTRRLTRPLK